MKLYGSISELTSAQFRGSSSGNAVTLQAHASAATATFTLPNASSDTVAVIAATQTLTNKTLDTSNAWADASDTTKKVAWSLSGATTAKTLTLSSSHTNNRTITFPDVTDTVVTLGATQTLTSKTLTSPTMTTPTLGVASSTSESITGTAGAGFLEMQEQSSAPSNPASGKIRFYSKTSDENLYFRNSSGTETQVGSGSGQKNYLQVGSNSAASWTATAGASNLNITTDTTAADLPRANTTKTGVKLLPQAVSSGTNAGTFTATNATPTVLTFSATGMQSGFVVYLANSGGALPTGLSASTPYWVTMVSSTTGKLSTSYANYLAGTFVAASSTGTGTQYYGCQLATYRFTLDAADYNVKQQLQWAQNILSGATGDWQVDVYSNTASDYSDTYTRLNLSTDSSSQSLLPNLEGTFRTTFDAPGSSAQYLELRLQNVSAAGNTHALVLSDAIAGPGVTVQGAAVTQWTTYTPTVAGVTTSAATGYYRRVGDTMQIEASFTASGTSSATVTFPLPTGYTINTAVLANGGGAAADAIGSGLLTATTDVAVAVMTDGASTLSFIKSGGTQRINGTDTIVSGNKILFTATVPVNEWAGSGTINVVQNDVEYVSNSSTADSSDTTSFAYGPAGTAIGSFTAVRSKRVRFNTPVSASDRLAVEVQRGTGKWIEVQNASFRNGIQSLQYQGAKAYGIGLDVATVSGTDIDVVFGDYAYGNSTSTYAAAGAAWSGFTTYNWRVKKTSGGQAVGFGTVQPGTSAGLVAAAGLPGNTTGNSIAAGYVGERLSFTSSAISGVTTGYTASTALVTLTPGIWLVYGNVQGNTAASLTGYQAQIASNNSNDSTGDIDATNTVVYDNNFGAHYPMIVGYYNISSSTAIYGKAKTFGANTTVTINGYAVRIA